MPVLLDLALCRRHSTFKHMEVTVWIVKAAALSSVSLLVSAAVVAGGWGEAGAAAAAPNLIKNGGFEKPACGAGVCDYSQGSNGIPHWNVGGDSVDLVSSAYWKPAAQKQSIDLAGNAPGEVTQSVPTAIGSKYTLKFKLAGNVVCGQPVKTVAVSWDGVLVNSYTFDTTGHNTQAMGWTQEKLTLTATAATSSVTFADASSDQSQCGAVIDQVSLQKK